MDISGIGAGNIHEEETTSGDISERRHGTPDGFGLVCLCQEGKPKRRGSLRMRRGTLMVHPVLPRPSLGSLCRDAATPRVQGRLGASKEWPSPCSSSMCQTRDSVVGVWDS